MTLGEAGLFAEWIDRKVDRCSDFVAYACNGFMRATTIPPDRSRWGTISILEHDTEEFLHAWLEQASVASHDASEAKLASYYAACMNESAIEVADTTPIRDLLATVDSVRDEIHGRRILDIGVGAGRTVPLLRAISEDYLAIDFTQQMVEICRENHAEANVEWGDARRLDRSSRRG